MKKIICILLAFIYANVIIANTFADTTVQKILFLGNSITYAGNYITDIEAYLITHHPNKKFEIINAGLPSETVSGLSEDGHADGKFPRPDLHERLDRVIAITHPDIVFACYGMNDGIYLPFDKIRFQKFKDGINWLHNKIVESGALIIHVTPPVYDELKGNNAGYANTLDKYSDWIISQHKSAGWEVANVHVTMKKYLEAHRKIDKKFHISGFALSVDGVHPNEVGHWIMAKTILQYLKEEEATFFSDIKAALSNNKNGDKIFNLVSQKQSIMKDAWLSASGHKRPAMKVGLPLAEAKLKAQDIEAEIAKLIY